MPLFKKKPPSAQLDPAKIPRHIGIIMDGNGRWAKARGLPRSVGHRAGVGALEKITEYCDSLGVKALTAYAFSTENWSRPQNEVDALMDMLYDYLANAEKRLGGRNVRIRIIGDLAVFDSRMKDAILHAETVTAKNTGILLNLAVNYGGRREITTAAKRLAEKCKGGKLDISEVSEDALDKLMYTGGCPEVDLIIRPSGELRLSNFLLWQAAYAELWFSDINWPDFSEKDMLAAILDFQKRDRRFGKTD